MYLKKNADQNFQIKKLNYSEVIFSTYFDREKYRAV